MYSFRIWEHTEHNHPEEYLCQNAYVYYLQCWAVNSSIIYKRPHVSQKPMSLRIVLDLAEQALFVGLWFRWYDADNWYAEWIYVIASYEEHDNFLWFFKDRVWWYSCQSNNFNSLMHNNHNLFKIIGHSKQQRNHRVPSNTVHTCTVGTVMHTIYVYCQ